VTSFREAYLGRYSTALVADAAFRAGVALGVPRAGLRPIAMHQKVAGPVRTVECNNDLVSTLVALHRTKPGDVLVIANREGEAGLIGDLVGTEARRRTLAGIVVDGLVRDLSVLIELDVPVFCRGHIPVGPLKLPPALKGIGRPGAAVSIGGAPVTPGMWAIGDADGVVFLESSDLEAVSEQAERSLERESVLLDAMNEGEPLGDLFGIEAFFEKRETDPGADFNEHVAQRGYAI
jgi:regulator of RNase E activity RraA